MADYRRSFRANWRKNTSLFVFRIRCSQSSNERGRYEVGHHRLKGIETTVCLVFQYTVKGILRMAPYTLLCNGSLLLEWHIFVLMETLLM